MNNFSNSNHRSIKDALSGPIGESFIVNFYKAGELWTSYRDTPAYSITARRAEELPVVSKVGVKPNGDPKWKTVWIDYVILAQPEKSIVHDGVFSIAMEIKTSYEDLMNAPSQFKNYRGTCDYNFVAVPKRLIRSALWLLKGIDDVGIMCYENGEVVKMPCKSKVNMTNKINMYQRLAFCPNQDTPRYIRVHDDDEE